MFYLRRVPILSVQDYTEISSATERVSIRGVSSIRKRNGHLASIRFRTRRRDGRRFYATDDSKKDAKSPRAVRIASFRKMVGEKCVIREHTLETPRRAFPGSLHHACVAVGADFSFDGLL